MIYHGERCIKQMRKIDVERYKKPDVKGRHEGRYRYNLLDSQTAMGYTEQNEGNHENMFPMEAGNEKRTIETESLRIAVLLLGG